MQFASESLVPTYIPIYAAINLDYWVFEVLPNFFKDINISMRVQCGNYAELINFGKNLFKCHKSVLNAKYGIRISFPSSGISR